MSLQPDNDDDRDLVERLRALPRSVEPERDLWPQLSAKMAARVRARRIRRIGWASGALAAAAAIALVVGWARHKTDVVAVREAATATTSAPGAIARPDPDSDVGLLPEEPAYRAAIAELKDAFATREGEMDPTAARAVREQLGALDDAVSEARAALARHPQDPELASELREDYQHEIDVLGDVIDLTTRT